MKTNLVMKTDLVMNTNPHVLVVAGSDSSGGAGLARDIETIAAMGLRTCLAVTAITVQTHDAFQARYDAPLGSIAQQMRAALKSNTVAAIKIAMLGCSRAIVEVSDVLREFSAIPVILDPVLTSTSGGELLEPAALESLRTTLLPQVTLVTPNIPELALLTSSRLAENQEALIDQAICLVGKEHFSVLVKGGHWSDDDCTDILFQRSLPPQIFSAPRIQASLRGSGCILSSAIAAQVAIGHGLAHSITIGRRTVLDQLKNNTRLKLK